MCYSTLPFSLFIDQYQDADTEYMLFVSNIANDEYPMSSSNGLVSLYFGNDFKTISAPTFDDQTDAHGNGYWIVGCFTGFSEIEMIEEMNFYSDNYDYDCYIEEVRTHNIAKK